MNSISSLPPVVLGWETSAEKVPMADKQKLWEASKSLEAIFTSYLLEEVGKKLPGTPHSTGSDIYSDMFKQTISQTIADQQSLGVAKTVYANALRQLCVKAEAAPTDKTSTSTEPL